MSFVSSRQTCEKSTFKLFLLPSLTKPLSLQCFFVTPTLFQEALVKKARKN